jgi:hypothetical protein
VPKTQILDWWVGAFGNKPDALYRTDVLYAAGEYLGFHDSTDTATTYVGLWDITRNTWASRVNESAGLYRNWGLFVFPITAFSIVDGNPVQIRLMGNSVVNGNVSDHVYQWDHTFVLYSGLRP